MPFVCLLSIMWLLVAAVPYWTQSGRKPGPPVPMTTAGTPTPPAQNTDEVISIRTREILLPVTVRNDYGRLSHDLGAHDFIVVEDGVRQEITSFNSRRVPLKIVILLDVSGSVFSEMETIRKASLGLVEHLAPGDEVCVIQFGKTIELLQDWTGDHEKIVHAITWRYRPDNSNYSETHLWDALFLAADEKLRRVEGRRTILLLTDGDDNFSKSTDAQALGATLRAEAALYVISKARAVAEDIKRQYGGLGGAVAGTRREANTIFKRLIEDEERMEVMAERTGGRLFNPLKSEELIGVYRQIADELCSQYVLTYVSTNEARQPAFRKISILLTRPGLKATTREGYYVQPEKDR